MARVNALYVTLIKNESIMAAFKYQTQVALHSYIKLPGQCD
jgi:hypothetical protein